MDYAIPRADVLPDIEVLSTVTPSPHHPLGVKGIGEAGTIASTLHGLQRGDRCARAVRRRVDSDADDARARVARDARARREPSHVFRRLRLSPGDVRSPRRSSCSRRNPGAKLLAGGHSLIPLMKLRLATPTAVIDIGRIPELRGIARSGGSDSHRRAHDARGAGGIGGSPAVGAPALAEAAALVGDPAVRNRGTIGGNIAHADPASDLPTVLVALGARIVVVGPRGERTIDAADVLHRHHERRRSRTTRSSLPIVVAPAAARARARRT